MTVVIMHIYTFSFRNFIIMSCDSDLSVNNLYRSIGGNVTMDTERANSAAR